MNHDLLMPRYTYGLVKLKTLLTPDHGSALQYADTYKYIQQCYAGVVLSTFVIVFGVVGIGIVSVQGYKEVTPAGMALNHTCSKHNDVNV